MLTLQEIKKRLQDKNVYQLGKNTGLHFNTIYRIKNGNSLVPSYKTIKILSDYLSE